MFQDGMIRGILSESLIGTTAKLTLTSSEAFPALIRKPDPNTASHRFHFSNFRYSFTLFSKFFASFPHGTCSLSVSHQYLALDGIYHPLRAAIPNNSTLRSPIVTDSSGMNGAVTLHGMPFQATLPDKFLMIWTLQTTIPKIKGLSSSRFTRRY